MKIGLFTATYLDMQVEEVFKMASGLGYQAVKCPPLPGIPTLILKPS
jgi:hypothetical protein